MNSIEVNGICGDKGIVYRIYRPLLSMELWNIKIDGESAGSMYRNGNGVWSSRCGPQSWLTEYEIKIFIEIIENQNLCRKA